MEELEEHRKYTIAETMIQHIGTKLVKRSAEPMTKLEYCAYRGWDPVKEEDADELVYLVEYEADERNKPNHSDHAGYISMSPKYVFDESYNKCETYMDRLLIERREITERINKLHTALANSKVPESEIDILGTQLNSMMTYASILNLRINNDLKK